MTDQDAALVARLREMANEGRQWKLPRVEVEQELVEEAVARIEALTAERDELRGWHRAALIASAPYVTEHNNPDEWQTQQTEALVRIFDRATAAEAALAERDKDAEQDGFHRESERQLLSWQERAANAEAALRQARAVMHGEGVEDQGEAWDKCLRILDAAAPAAPGEKP